MLGVWSLPHLPFEGHGIEWLRFPAFDGFGHGVLERLDGVSAGRILFGLGAHSAERANGIISAGFPVSASSIFSISWAREKGLPRTS